jgi:hypothetical protein
VRLRLGVRATRVDGEQQRLGLTVCSIMRIRT